HVVRDGLLHRTDDVTAVVHPDQALGAVDGVARVELPLALRLEADELIALVVDGEDGGDGVLAALVGDELDVPAFLDDRRARVRRAEVDADDGLLVHRVWAPGEALRLDGVWLPGTVSHPS